MLPKLKVLFLCTKNSCRSQMAEGWARALHPDRLDARSAGTNPGPVDPRAIQVMREAGVDISAYRSKSVHELLKDDFDSIVTVCDRAAESCPVFPRPVRRMHQGFDDPATLNLGAYRRVRDEIRAFVESLPARLQAEFARTPRPAQEGELAAVLALVEAAGLPTAGIAEAFPKGYAVVDEGGDVLGVAGLEMHGDVGLLRSVAVAPLRRGTGMGVLLTQDRLRAATTMGLASVYLLTTTAADFFSKLGFKQTARASAPEQLQGSSEFASVCPSTAVCMVMTLRGGTER